MVRPEDLLEVPHHGAIPRVLRVGHVGRGEQAALQPVAVEDLAVSKDRARTGTEKTKDFLFYVE